MADKWISLTDKQPADFIRVLITDGLYVAEGYRTPEGRIRRACVMFNWEDYMDGREPTHWQPMPTVEADSSGATARWGGWTLCIDKEPEKRLRVILTDGKNVAEGYKSPDGWYARPAGNDWRDIFGSSNRVVAWRPLPAPPPVEAMPRDKARRILSTTFRLQISQEQWLAAAQLARIPIPRDEWREDDGVALWWDNALEQLPYIGCPLDDNFPAWADCWTPIIVPDMPGWHLNGGEEHVE